MTRLFDNTMNNSEFPDELKLAEVTATFKKKDDPTKSKNHSPVNVLPTVSKVFERTMHRLMSIFLKNFYPLMCVGTEKVLVHNKPHCL